MICYSWKFQSFLLVLHLYNFFWIVDHMLYMIIMVISSSTWGSPEIQSHSPSFDFPYKNTSSVLYHGWPSLSATKNMKQKYKPPSSCAPAREKLSWSLPASDLWSQWTILYTPHGWSTIPNNQLTLFWSFWLTNFSWLWYLPSILSVHSPSKYFHCTIYQQNYARIDLIFKFSQIHIKKREINIQLIFTLLW